MKNNFTFLLFCPAIFFAQIPAGYYDSTENLSGYALKSKLHEILSKKSVSYGYSDVGTLYKTTDQDKYYENDGTVLDIYSENPAGADGYEYNFNQNISSASAEGQGWNKEHGMPQSTFYGIYPMYSDIHYLIPADAYINQRRSNYPYARNNGDSKIYTNGSKLGKSTTPGYKNSSYEPIDEFKGDVARYLLYFVTRYEGSLHLFNYDLATSPLDGSEEKGYEDWYIAMLKEWNALDPVSQREIDRNNEVYSFQKVRNPFIDHPEWVNAVWSETADTSAPAAVQNLTVSKTGESYATLSWDPATESDVLGYRIYANGNYIGYSKATSFEADRLSPGTTYNFTVSAYDKGYLVSPVGNVASATTAASDDFAKDLMITKYIEGTTDSTNGIYNDAIEISNKTGHAVDLTNYYINIQFKSATGYYFSDAYKLEGSIPAGGKKVIVNNKASFPDYPLSSADYVTGAPPLTYTGSQYVELSYGTKYLKTASTNNYDISFSTVDAVGIKSAPNSLGNKSLYRNADVKDPNTVFTISEWTEHPQDYHDGLGVLAAAESATPATAMLYPNPVSDMLYISLADSDKISFAKIFTMEGRLILAKDKPFKAGNALDLRSIQGGIYLLNLDGKVYKIIKKP